MSYVTTPSFSHLATNLQSATFKWLDSATDNECYIESKERADSRGVDCDFNGDAFTIGNNEITYLVASLIAMNLVNIEECVGIADGLLLNVS